MIMAEPCKESKECYPINKANEAYSSLNQVKNGHDPLDLAQRFKRQQRLSCKIEASFT